MLRKAKTRRRKSANRVSSSQCEVQTLPEKVLLSASNGLIASATKDGGTLVIDGVDSDVRHDDVEIRQKEGGGVDVILRAKDADGVVLQTRVQSMSRPNLIKFRGFKGNDKFKNYTDIRSIANGGKGDDTMIGGSQADHMRGGSGNDRMYGNAGMDSMNGGLGNDVMYGGADVDTMWGDRESHRSKYTDGNDTIIGNNGSDKIKGNGGDDLVYAGHGDDQVSGGLGDDTIRGGTGKDILGGGHGNDKLYGERDDDWLLGGPGADYLNGGKGNDDLSGFADRLDVDTLVGGAGWDSFDAYFYGNEQYDIFEDLGRGDGVNVKQV